MSRGWRSGGQAAADVDVVPVRFLVTEEATMEEEGDTHHEMKHFPPLWPLFRTRSKSDTSGFRSRVLFRLRGACSGRINHTVLPKTVQLSQPVKLLNKILP